jgi:hypothetical protein
MKDAAAEHSVFRIASLLHQDICGLGTWRVCPTRKKNFYGFASLRVEAILRIGPVVRSDEPPKRHAIIHQWPATKEERLSVAQQLAAEAEYVPNLLDLSGGRD